MRNRQIIELLNRTGKTQTQLAARLGITRASVSERLNKKEEVDSIEFVKAVAELTGYSLCDLIKGEIAEEKIATVNEPLPSYGNAGLIAELNQVRKELIDCMKERDELKKFLPAGGEAKLKKQTK